MTQLPGQWLERFADLSFSSATNDRVFRPIIADMQSEYDGAVTGHRTGEAKWIVARGRAGFILSVFKYLATRRYQILTGGRTMSTGMRPITLTIALGVLGAMVVVGSAMWFTPGSQILLPFAFVVVGTGVVLRSTRVESFGNRFVIGLGSFMIVMVVFYLWVFFVFVPRQEGHTPPISFFGHVWRAASMLAIGVVVNGPLAVVTAVPKATSPMATP